MSAQPKPQLIEISASVRYHVVLVALNEKDALEHVETWEESWNPGNADLIEVEDVEVFDARPLTARDWRDVAHERTSDAGGTEHVESRIPTRPGFYWYSGDHASPGQWQLVRVYRPEWEDKECQELSWMRLNGSGGFPFRGGDWSPEVRPPIGSPRLPVSPSPTLA